MTIIKYSLLSILGLVVLGISTKHSVDQNYFFKDTLSSEIVYLDKNFDNENIFIRGHTTINKFKNNDVNYLDIIFEKDNLILMPDFIPILDQNKIEIQADSKKLNMRTSGLDFFMLFNSNIFDFSFNSIISNHIHLLWWVILGLLIYKLIIFAIKRFQLSSIITSVSLILIAIMSSQYINHINNFRVLGIHSKFSDNLDSKFIRSSILVVPFERLNYNLAIRSKIINFPQSDNNIMLLNSVAGPENLIYFNNGNIFAQQALLDNKGNALPYKQEIFSKYQPNIDSGSDLNFQIKNSKFVSLSMNSEVGGKRGFYYPVLRNLIVFPKINQEIVSNFDYNLNIYTQIKSLKSIENSLLFLCFLLTLYSIRLIKNVK
jgi:hypothetical protein